MRQFYAVVTNKYCDNSLGQILLLLLFSVLFKHLAALSLTVAKWMHQMPAFIHHVCSLVMF